MSEITVADAVRPPAAPVPAGGSRPAGPVVTAALARDPEGQRGFFALGKQAS
jgi:hypothetical protein